MLKNNNIIREYNISDMISKSMEQLMTINHLARRAYDMSVTHRFSSLKFVIDHKASNVHGTYYHIEGTEDELFKFISSTVSPNITREQFTEKYL